MKNILIPFVSLVVLATMSYCSGSRPAAVTPPVTLPDTVAAEPLLKNAVDSFSYALGVSMAGFYRAQGIDSIDADLVIRALNDVSDSAQMMDEAACNNAIISYMQAVKGRKAAANKAEGTAFLDSNKTQAGVVTLPSGLQYRVIREGSGQKPGPNDKVKVHYEGSLIGGKIFDSSIQRGEPIELNVSGVISGWTEALQLMPVGSKWKLYIPSDLGYGDSGAGADIKPGSTLIFDVELLDIVK